MNLNDASCILWNITFNIVYNTYPFMFILLSGKRDGKRAMEKGRPSGARGACVTYFLGKY